MYRNPFTVKGVNRAIGDASRFVNHILAGTVGTAINAVIPESSKEFIGQAGKVLDPSKLANTAGYAI
ncbi:hypothetical protein [uncultured Leptotrichia sp.]|uniref:hypothetical protein n=1 Tax=uncultured Leptotrichia sp. TaxID=159271 RepID=UPI0025E6F733|nr:hypothetical protein [uncultured Leptotrichia sp.]